MKKRRIRLNWDNIFKDAMIAAAIAVFCLVVYITAEPIEQPEATTETTGSEYIMKSYFDVPLSEDLQDYIFELCEEYEIAPEIIVSMIEKESDFIASEIGDNGKSEGLMQIQRHYHSDRMKKLNVTDLLNPFDNVTVGIDFFAELLDYYEGNTEKALIAYNAGKSGANEHFFCKGIYSNDYSKEVLENSEILKEGMIQMFTRTDDPVRDFLVHDAEQQKALEKCPKCSMCDEYIQDDYLYEINDEVICEECLKDNFRKNVEDYIA